MKAIIDVLFPLTHPTPFLVVVGECFAWSAAGAVVVLIVIRFGWRRGKGLEDL